MTLRFVSLFSGIGGADLGLEAAGWTCVAHSEIEDYPRRILRQHWPKVPLYGDIKNIRGKDLPAHDVISAGTPCQPASTAGSRRGVSDDRWLWPEVIRLVDECRPKYAVFENPPGLLSVNKGEAFAQILGDLDVLGYAVEWTVFSAARLGARHLRKRVWVVAYPIRGVVREQPGRRGGEGGPGQAFAGEHGAARAASDGDGDGGGQRGPGRPAGRGARLSDEAQRGPAASDAPDGGGGLQGPQGLRGREPVPGRGGEAGSAPDGDSLGRVRGPDGPARGRSGLEARRGGEAGSSPDGEAGSDAVRLGPAEPGRRSVFGSHARALLDAAFISNTAPGAIWSTGCRLGGALHGLPDGPQHPEGWGWECGVPRVRQNQRHWKERIKAQGNAACPPCAEAVGHLINLHARRY